MREELCQPPVLAPDTLRIIPMGGLGDIGRNMTSFEHNGKILLVDCGVLFPDETHPGVDLILPALDLLDERITDVVALVLTHGHEDHIGAVPYLLRSRLDIPIYGTRLTLALVQEKLKEHRIHGAILHEVKEDDLVELPEFLLEFLSVNHSIPDAVAVAIHTNAGKVLHTGDFKLDQLPLDGRITDLRGFARLGTQGIDLFMVDSTNADCPGFTTHERDILPAIERVFAKAKQKLIVACFASHMHRVQQVLDCAANYGRKVVFVGRSMIRNMTTAAELGYLRIPGGILVELKDIENYRDDELVIISTGSQGEPMSALSRISNHDHPIISAGPGDVVLLASSLIPGNENSVYRVINSLAKNGVQVVHKGNALVHVSGHAAAGELLYCYNIVQPKNVMPIHGEARHLIANAKLAAETGVPNTVVVEDGAVVDLAQGVAKVVGKLPCNYVFVDGSSVGEIGEAELTARKILAEEGFVSVIVGIKLSTKEIVLGPDLQARGFAEDDASLEPVGELIKAELLLALRNGVSDSYQLQQVARRTLGKYISQSYRRRPMIVPVVLVS